MTDKTEIMIDIIEKLIDKSADLYDKPANMIDILEVLFGNFLSLRQWPPER